MDPNLNCDIYTKMYTCTSFE